MKKNILIIPPNDFEAIMILRLAKAIDLPVIISSQPHGASLDKEPDIVNKIIESGANKAVIVEMPGVKTEKQLLKKGLEVKIIDHHRYQNLNRKKIKSSLEQFLTVFHLNDKKLLALGFDPRLVHGVAIFDRGFIWSLQNEGYSENEIKKVLAWQKKLMRPFTDPVIERRYEQAAKLAWQKRIKWQDFFIITTYTKEGLRRYVSLLVARKFDHPVPIIFDERGRGVILVQDFSGAEKLFKKFGGFTFGEKGNWGYKNEPGKPKVTLVEVMDFLKKESKNKI
ncbi:MAG: hypothetical protein V1664_04580 [Candidatus Uhrbacteria bacterium]